MKKLLMVIPWVFLLCFVFGCNYYEDSQARAVKLHINGTHKADFIGIPSTGKKVTQFNHIRDFTIKYLIATGVY